MNVQGRRCCSAPTARRKDRDKQKKDENRTRARLSLGRGTPFARTQSGLRYKLVCLPRRWKGPLNAIFKVSDQRKCGWVTRNYRIVRSSQLRSQNSLDCLPARLSESLLACLPNSVLLRTPRNHCSNCIAPFRTLFLPSSSILILLFFFSNTLQGSARDIFRKTFTRSFHFIAQTPPRPSFVQL